MTNDAQYKLDQLRDAGWLVGVHNDYVLSGERWTFWLLTHPESGRFVKGEGMSDLAALTRCFNAIQDGEFGTRPPAARTGSKAAG